MKISIRESINQIKTFSRVFVERPRFAMVISILLTIAGVMAITSLPITQYPRVTPPEIRVTYTYPGSNSREVMNTIATPIENEINGVDDMIYMSSECADDGTYSLSVSFEVESDQDMDLVKVQNRLSQAEAKLPAEAKELGGRVRAQSTDNLGFIALQSPGKKVSRLQMSDYAYNIIQPVLLRVPGVGDAQIYGPKLSVRVWMDPNRMAAQGMNSEEVIAAISKQNVQASLGVVGSAPVQKHGAFSYTLLSKGRLLTAKEFDEIVIRRDENGGMVRLKDVARTEIGEESYSFDGQYNNATSIQIAINQKPGANAIATMDAVLAELDRLQPNFPGDMKYIVAYDATRYVRMCISEIVETLVITFILVVLVCYIFLQDWRATLIPCLTIPVSICSTFIVMAMLDYSINILTLFGLVLAIGVVVDDCIVVVERVQYLIETRGYNSKEATIQAMSDVTSAVIATTLVLLGIFVPIGFMSGIQGRIYQQFSVTLSTAVCFSTVCALTLAPALCSLLLREARPFKHGPLAWFNWGVDKFKGFFVGCARWLSGRLMLVGVLLTLTILGAVQMFRHTETSFLPSEDQAVVFVSMEMPEGTTLPRTRDVAMRAVDILNKMPEVKSCLTVQGFSFTSGRGESQCLLVADLEDWNKRPRKDQSAAAMVGRIQKALSVIPEPSWRVFMPPAIPGLGMSDAIDLRLESTESTDPALIDEVQGKVLRALNANPNVMAAFSGFTSKTPHLRFNMDRDKAQMFHVPVATAYSTMQNYLGSRYVNDVNLGTQVNRVTVRADWSGRATPEDVQRLYVRSDTGSMVPLGSLGTITRELSPRTMKRFNMYPSADLTVMPKPGVATGTVIKEIAELMKAELPKGFAYEWGGITFQEQRTSGSTAPLVGLALIFGYLFLVAQYESWTIPMPVMLSIFVAVLGALVGLKLFGLSLSIYAQLGLVLLVGLASKNAILIVEFAKDKRELEGYSIVEAAASAAGERLRALLMTALTTLLGTLPMVLNLFFPKWCAAGAGAASRNAIGITEFFGMGASVAFGILLVPGLYALFETWREHIKRAFNYLQVTSLRKRQLKDRASK